MSKWHDREDEMRKLVAAGLTDSQIGAVFDGASATTICNARKDLGIPSQFKRKPTFGRPEPVEPLVGEVYTDEKGLTVTRYPARYATGAGGQAITARPRR